MNVLSIKVSLRSTKGYWRAGEFGLYLQQGKYKDMDIFFSCHQNPKLIVQRSL